MQNETILMKKGNIELVKYERELKLIEISLVEDDKVEVI